MISSADLIPGGLTGRTAETAAIRRALARSRLVTVTGLPGVGKTATAITAAMGVNGSFPDGVALIRLDALQDEALLPHTIAAAMLLPDTFGPSPLTSLTEQFDGKHMLLMLDTCEHLLGACATIASAITEQCPGIRVLATSREPLRVPGEDTMVIQPLSARDAVRLLSRREDRQRDRQTSQQRNQQPSQQRDRQTSQQNERSANPREVQRGGGTARAVCERLDGLPLALGMAAHQLRLGSLDALLAGLETGYEFLFDPNTPIARHRTLNAAVGWSHQLCTPAERLLWARLALFDGPFSVKDCQEVCVSTHLREDNVAVGVAMLAERSLLLRETGMRETGPRETGMREAGGPARYLMPRVIRAYGLGMLRRLAENEEMRRRYGRWRSGPRRDEIWS